PRHPRHRRRHSTVRGRRAGSRRDLRLDPAAVRGLRPLPAGSGPGPLQPGGPRVPRAGAAPAALAAGDDAPPAGSIRLEPDRARPLAARRGDRPRAARARSRARGLAPDPVTRVLQARGEPLHPASRLLSGESAHIESEAGEHDLHVFQAWRNMDEILLANFMVLHDLLEAEPFDLVIGDEAWETDYYLHENPELKRTAFAWLTDFVGWLPMDPRPDSPEARLAADYNAEMIEQIARFPRVRDRALFVGGPDDVVDLPFGPGQPSIREW